MHQGFSFNDGQGFRVALTIAIIGVFMHECDLNLSETIEFVVIFAGPTGPSVPNDGVFGGVFDGATAGVFGGAAAAPKCILPQQHFRDKATHEGGGDEFLGA